MVESIVNDWLEEFSSLTESEIHKYAKEQSGNEELVKALHAVHEEYIKYFPLISPVCNQLLIFLRSGEEELRRFALQFVPSLIYLYLRTFRNVDKAISRCVETLLIGLYNLEVLDNSRQPKVYAFRVPSIAQSSIYHEPSALAESFPESVLKRWEDCNTKKVSWGPMPQIETLNGQNRMKMLAALMFIYNRGISRFSHVSIAHMCKITSRLVTQGFYPLRTHSSGPHVNMSPDSDPSHGTTLVPRLPLSPAFQLELLHSVYCAIYCGGDECVRGVALQALEDLHSRARLELHSDVLMVCQAMRNLVKLNKGRTDVVMNSHPTSSKHTARGKSMITNASFRTKKLPDDIPIQDDEDGEVGATALNSITEEREQLEDAEKPKRPSKETSSALKNLPKTISGLGKKVKEAKEQKAAAKNSPKGGGVGAIDTTDQGQDGGGGGGGGARDGTVGAAQTVSAGGDSNGIALSVHNGGEQTIVNASGNSNKISNSIHVTSV